MRVFLSAGEPSGDHHAAALVRELRRLDPTVECAGLGGPDMQAAGCVLLADLTALAVMWFLRVIGSLHRFVELARRAERSFLDARPDVLVLVDFPGFHWWLAWRAKRHGIPVIFYCPPQIWAWGSWRVGKMRRLVDRVLSPLPFEHEWFRAQGIDSTLVGHPFFDAAPAPATGSPDATVAREPMLLLLPGSRGQEIEANLASLLAAAERVRAAVRDLRIVVACLHERHAATARDAVSARGLSAEVTAGEASRLIRHADAAISVSGSVSLELLAARVPTVIVYRIGAFAFVVQSFFRHARFITLVNLLAVEHPILPVRRRLVPPRDVEPSDPAAVYPEFLCVQDPAAAAAAHVSRWLTVPESRRQVRERIEQIAAAVALPGASRQAAEAVLQTARAGIRLRAAPSRREDLQGRSAA